MCEKKHDTLENEPQPKGIKAMSYPKSAHEKTKPFSALLFCIIITLSVTLYLTLVSFVAPHVWDAQWRASIWVHCVTFIICHLCYGIFEHPFHRYVLHSPLIPGLSHFYKSHTKHHGLTSVVLRKTGVENYYPIIEEKQHEASFFPWYSYAVFVLILSPFFILIQWMFPTIPIFLDGSLALAWSISLYELLHATEHYPLEKWIPKLEHPNQYLRKFWRTAYAFHLRHHVQPKCNEGISGFFAIPIADFLFGTWVNPSTLYVHGTWVDKKEFEPPTPVFFIRWIDEFAEKRKRKRRGYSV